MACPAKCAGGDGLRALAGGLLRLGLRRDPSGIGSHDLVAGPEIVGFAEAARVAAQPVLVVTTGVAATLASEHLRAAASVGSSRSDHRQRAFFLVIAVAGISYLFLAGFRVELQPGVHADPHRLRHCPGSSR